MTEEREIKIPVASDFVLPDLDAVVRRDPRGRPRAPSSSRRRTGTPTRSRCSTPNSACATGVPPARPGSWTLKAGRAHGRPGGLTRGDRLHGTAGPAARGRASTMIRAAVGDVVLHPVASLVTDPAHRRPRGRRHPVEPRSPTTVWRSARRTGRSTTFREVEVELFDADQAAHRRGDGAAARRRRRRARQHAEVRSRAAGARARRLRQTDRET